MLNPWARVLMWAIVILFALLVLSVVNTASASTLVIKDGVVTMSEADFKKLAGHARGLEEALNRASNKAILYQELYEDARMCVTKLNAAGLAVTPCFNQNNEYRDGTGEYLHPNVTAD